MRTGNIVRRDDLNAHLDGDEWIEVFPDGASLADFNVTTTIPRDSKSWTAAMFLNGQSPLLVRKSYWDRHFKDVPITLKLNTTP